MADRTEREVLNGLIVTCRDAARGFQWAADHASAEALRTYLTSIADERRQFAAELLPHAHRLGGGSEGDGSSAAALHRLWMSLKDRFAGNHDQSLIVEAERGERIALAAYDEAINGVIPPDVRDLVERQRGKVQDAQARLHAMTGPA